MAKAKKPQEEIPEAKIRQVIWMIKAGKTKKACCEHLGIAYNTKRLDSIIEEFNSRAEREKQLKKAAQKKIFTQKEKEGIAKEYLNGEAQSAIAKQYFISPQRVKNILIEMNVPIRGRGKNSEAKVDHVVQDLEIKFKKDDRVFIPKYNCFGFVCKVFDEEYLDYLENGRQRYVETYPFKPNKLGMSGNYVDETRGIHYEIYWILEDGTEFKLSAMEHMRDRIIKTIEETGREFYSVWKDDEYGGFHYLLRDQLFPVIKAA
jgi:DNA-binding CsgD family transcriptional regulator